MRKILVVIGASLFLSGAMGLVMAEPKGSLGTKAEAMAMVEKAAAWAKEQGKEKTLAEITRAGSEKKGEFIDRDLYLFAYDFNGVVLAHGANPKLIGKNLMEMQDADGKFMVKGMVETAKKGSGWYAYKWSNPITKKTEEKIAYVVKIDDRFWIGCGVYGKEAGN